MSQNIESRALHRYPDPNFDGTLPGEQRSVDFIDPDSGETLHRLVQSGMDKIISLNEFSPSGDALLSGMSGSVVIWKKKENLEREEEEEDKDTEKKTTMARSCPQPSSSLGMEVIEWPDFEKKRKRQTKNEKTKTKTRTETKE